MERFKIIFILFILSLFSGCFEVGKKSNYDLDPNNSTVQRDGRRQGPSQPDEPDDNRTGPDTGNPDERDMPDEPGNDDGDTSEDDYDVDELLARIELLKTKKRDWDEIVEEGISSYEDIAPILKKKCLACHDSDRSPPWYGKPFRNRNGVYKRYVDGLSALDFSRKFPLRSKGSSDQVALLNAVKNSVLDETMPPKKYTRFSSKRRITTKDKLAIKRWAEPLIDKIKDWEQKYIYDLEDDPRRMPDDGDNEAPPVDILEISRKKVKRIFSAKCYRCHANRVARGRFGKMEDLSYLVRSKYINLKNPDASRVFKTSESGRMPPSSRNRVTSSELFTMLEWITLESEAIK